MRDEEQTHKSRQGSAKHKRRADEPGMNPISLLRDRM